MSYLAAALEANEKLEAENARLKAELDQLRPKPVVKTALYHVRYTGARVEMVDSGYTNCTDNLKLTFTDGKLSNVEMI